MHLKEALEYTGMTASESMVYLALLKSGSSSAGSIARETGLHRRTVYDVLERLLERGLAGRITKNNRFYFGAASPQSLLDHIREKEHIISKAIPELNALFVPSKKDEIKVFRGKYGLKTIFEDQIREKKPIMILGASLLAYDLFKYYFKWFDRRRQRERIKVRAIFSSSMHSKIKRIPSADIRFLPERYVGLTAINVYGGKVSLILWSENPVAILIENREISDSYKKLFELMWSRARK